ncbi:beta-N-acetylhexosaminidase [Spirochaeta cellobiosiphila]|uniref:beta-N-acetylhexosaminidase n=1 Tax=Spirochaeta cellobiosiphila TaxID=504483 RepID=UPI00146A3BAE|nr:beta-N-acetylhexosaminidase [Spirochaeta cellobiosiphila]
MKLIPTPQKWQELNGEFILSAQTRFKGPEIITTLLNEDYPKYLLFQPIIVSEKADIEFRIDSELGINEYQISMSDSQVIIKGDKDLSLLHGYQSFFQILLSHYNYQNGIANIPCVNITDQPKLEWRGMHLDSSRHMQSIAWIKKFIDILALHRFNRFHWHLTDDQGWRIEIDSFPKLNTIAANRHKTRISHQLNDHVTYDTQSYGGYYAKEEIRSVVAHAKKRGIEVVPEVDMPGHMQAAITAYPEWGCQVEPAIVKEDWGISEIILNPCPEVIAAMKIILDEVMELFPFEYIHLGGDEALKTQWEKHEGIQRQMAELGIEDVEELQGWFMTEVSKHLNGKGRKLVAWDEILDGKAPDDCLIMSWQSDKGAAKALSLELPTIINDQRFFYFDHYQGSPDNDPLAFGGFTSCQALYNHDPFLPLGDKQDKILGIQGQIWTEYMRNEQTVERMAFPRVIAFAEKAWHGKAPLTWDDFKVLLKNHFFVLDRIGVNYYHGSLE